MVCVIIIIVKNGYDILDAHYHLKEIIYLREADGIHWQPSAIRLVTKLVLSHISIAFDISFINRYLDDADKSKYSYKVLEKNYEELPFIKICGCLVSSN